ncbi:sphingomyelin phosphodiesterase [Longispora albida]|uniref:sphingomyelin phosphodiesterase n=1 Tax=Longispora albida TaxID=203523 RepID=UPI00047830AA
MSRLTAAVLAIAAGLSVAVPASPAAAATPALKVLSHNVMFLPRTLFPNWGQIQRADLISRAPYVAGNDVVVLQEMFDNEASERLKAGLAGQYPHQTPVLGRSRSGWDATLGSYSDTTPEDGGVVIASRWPIREKIQFVYADGCGADWYSNKGFVYVRLDVNGTAVHVVGTHAQADDTGCEGGDGASVRARQFAQLDAFLDARNIPAAEQVIVAGDLNVDRYAPEYQAMLGKLGAAAPSFAGHPYSWDARTNAIADYNDSENNQQQLDYVLHRNGNARPATWQNTTLKAKSPQWSVTSWWTTYTYTDYSDHYPVLGS